MEMPLLATKIGLLASVACVLTNHAISQSRTPDSTTTKEAKTVRYGITIDQDMLVEAFGLGGKNEDRNYTMGLGLFLSNNRWATKRLFQPLRRLGNVFYKSKTDERSRQNTSLTLGGTGFTPRYLRDNVTDSLYYILNDRPFASLTFLSFQYHLASPFRIETSQLVLGVLGLGIASAVQTHIHENHWFGSTRDIPTGWKYQVSNKGEPTLLLSHKTDKLLSRRSYDPKRENNINSQFIFSREYRLGYYTGAAAGMAMRIGLLDPNNWPSYDRYQLSFANNLSKDFTNRAVEESKLKSELYIQLSVKPQFVLYNALLMGQFKENFHDFSFSEIQHFIIEGFGGIGVTLTNAKQNFAVNVMGYISGRTPEFKTVLYNRSHLWGGIQLSFIRIKPN